MGEGLSSLRYFRSKCAEQEAGKGEDGRTSKEETQRYGGSVPAKGYFHFALG